MEQVRVRFAPSPTGFFHIGSARTALFNWLYARHTGGTFVLRVEDTDKERNRDECLQLLLDGMRWLGLDWDEGPEVGGNYGPYFQSQRDDIYMQYLEILKAKDFVYEQDGAIYFKVSNKPQIIHDVIRGDVERMEEKDFVIFRSNGTPVFHFVNVVDDIKMKITHIIRGEDHLSNTSKHVELFKAFEVPIPKFAHIPLILKTSGPGKMSKRDEGALIEDYEKRRFLPEALRNYLSLLGWSPKDNREILNIEEIVRLFELEDINSNNAKFDEQKLSFMNVQYLRSLPIEKLAELAQPVLEQNKVINENTDKDYILRVFKLAQEKITNIEHLAEFLGYFFREDYNSDNATKEKIFKKGDPVARMQELVEAIQEMETFTAEAIEKRVKELTEEKGTKPGDYMLTARYAVSGQGMGPSFYGVLEVLGKETVTKRINKFTTKNYIRNVNPEDIIIARRNNINTDDSEDNKQIEAKG